MTDNIYRQVRVLIESRGHCVMATASGNRPYCSLMAYVVEPGEAVIYMVTHRHTRKFRNLSGNPAVSLLVDSRETDRPGALTVEGVFSEVPDGRGKARVRSLFLTRHPHMRSFMDHADAVFIRIDFDSALYLDGLTDAHHVTFPEKQKDRKDPPA